LNVVTLTKCNDANALDWIIHATQFPVTDGTVARLVPAGFDSYAQILHAINLEPGVRTLRNVKFVGAVSEAAGRVNAALAELGARLPSGVVSVRSRSGGSILRRRGKRVLWSELAQFLGDELDVPASFERNLWDKVDGDWPDELDGPAEGSLTLAEGESLAAVLAPFTAGTVTYWYTWANTPNYEGACYRGSLKDLARLFRSEGFTASPEYWWPDDRSWVVHTDIDSMYTLVAGPAGVFEALTEANGLESMELRSDTVLWRPRDHLRSALSASD